MDAIDIDKAFSDLINTRAIHKVLDTGSSNIRAYRQLLKNGQPISLDLKMKLLKKAGHELADEQKFTRQDLVDLVDFVNKEGVVHEPDYAVHKFLLFKESQKKVSK